MQGPLQYLANAGVLGWLALLLTFVLVITGGLLFVVARHRAAFLVLLGAATLPLLVGALGTWLGHRIVDRVSQRSHVSDADREEGLRQAKAPLHLGASGAALVGLLAITGLCIQGKKPGPAA